MLGRESAVSVPEARERMTRHVIAGEPPSVLTTLDKAYQRILSEDVFSPEDLPGFSRSTVDGFAVTSSDTFGATEGLPAYLNVSHEILMGEEPSFRLLKGTASKIATGGMLPQGADAVVMLEHAQYADGGLIEVLKPVAPRENVISAGEDMKKGEVLLRKGHQLRSQDIAALAGVGIEEVKVYEKPKVSIILTGDEIVPLGRAVRPGQVRDMNSFTLAGLIRKNGGIPVKKGICKDVYEEIRNVVRESLDDSDMVLITGGSSVGTKDMTAEIIEGLGSPGVLFHGVTLKPGKPTIGAVVDGTPVFGLPGHPAAVAVCFEVFILPVLRMLTGREEKEYQGQKRIRVRLARNISSSVGREEHVRIALEERDNELWAVPVLGKSGLIRTLVKADGTIVIPAPVRGLEEGEMVDVVLF
ncbi:MAG TPA: gephyrin-like molybdotransferase Glp [Thermodesulfovibrionales bacterium]|nr:gephyrin-like molybdotransferase Glp [Thermodesulfovibrionales bacterium]